MFCVPFASTFVVHCLQGSTSYVNEQGCGGFSKSEAMSVLFFPIVLTMDGRNPVYIDLTLISVGALMGDTMLLKPRMFLALHKHVDQGKGTLMIAHMWTSLWK